MSKELQSHGKGCVWKRLTVNDSGLCPKSAHCCDQDVSIQVPTPDCSDASTATAYVFCRCDLGHTIGKSNHKSLGYPLFFSATIHGHGLDYLVATEGASRLEGWGGVPTKLAPHACKINVKAT